MPSRTARHKSQREFSLSSNCRAKHHWAELHHYRWATQGGAPLGRAAGWVTTESSSGAPLDTTVMSGWHGCNLVGPVLWDVQGPVLQQGASQMTACMHACMPTPATYQHPKLVSRTERPTGRDCQLRPAAAAAVRQRRSLRVCGDTHRRPQQVLCSACASVPVPARTGLQKAAGSIPSRQLPLELACKKEQTRWNKQFLQHKPCCKPATHATLADTAAIFLTSVHLRLSAAAVSVSGSIVQPHTQVLSQCWQSLPGLVQTQGAGLSRQR